MYVDEYCSYCGIAATQITTSVQIQSELVDSTLLFFGLSFSPNNFYDNPSLGLSLLVMFKYFRRLFQLSFRIPYHFLRLLCKCMSRSLNVPTEKL